MKRDLDKLPIEQILSGSETDEKLKTLMQHQQAILELLGEDSQREGLIKTPLRVAKSQLFLTSGYQQDPQKIIQSALFRNPNDSNFQHPVTIKDIEYFSLCEHHMLPFFGRLHIAYIPNEYVVGLSKIPRVVEAFSRRLQIQEKLTVEVRKAIEEALQPWGVAVAVEGSHLCMMMRGVQNTTSKTLTTSFSGKFNEDALLRKEFLASFG